MGDLRWAWRGVAGRGWRAVLIVGVLALAIAANTAVFAVADALIFHPYPYPSPDRILSLRETLPEGTSLTLTQGRERLEAWRRQSDLLSGVGGYLGKTVFLTDSGIAERTRTADVTVGFFAVLGVKPEWGRPFKDGDESAGEFIVLVSAELARRRFGHPALAPGRVLTTTVGPHRVVGVMPEDFAYPSPSYHLWRALDPAGPLMRGFGGVSMEARVAPGVPMEDVARRLGERALAIGASLGLASYSVTARPAMPEGRGGARRTLLLLLLGAAICLLLGACASVASLELAAAVGRAQAYAVRVALGASRASLIRVAALEGAMIIGAALALGVGFLWTFAALLVPIVPESLLVASQNRVGVDARAIGYTATVAGGAWLCAVVVPLLAALRPNLLAVLRLEDRTAATSRAGTRLRRVLTAAEVAVAVMLVIGGLLYARSYRRLLVVEKGFDSRSLVQLTWTLPGDHFRGSAGRGAAVARMKEALLSVPGVEAVTAAAPPPSIGDSPSQAFLEIDGQPPLTQRVRIGAKWIDESYFAVIRMPVRSGRVFASGDPPTDVVVSETFARRFWPGVDAVGHNFRRTPTEAWRRVIGVVGDVRSERTAMPAVQDDRIFFYARLTPATGGPAAPPASAANVLVDSGGSYGFIGLTLRLDQLARARAVLATARTLEPTLNVTLDHVDDLYARQSADTRFASQVVGGFSLIALVVALAGVYGLMAYQVSSRRREIGIRMSLGADSRDIIRLVFASSARLVVVGAGAGVAGALLASRWIESALFGLTATDPGTYVVVVMAVVGTAMAASWSPARVASRVSPAELFRSQ